MLFEGESNRSISEHRLNKNSSRAHSVFTIHLEMRSKVESSEKVVVSKLNIVDLAGSERTKKTGITLNLYNRKVRLDNNLLKLHISTNP
jgi:kinesin family protein 6/9